MDEECKERREAELEFVTSAYDAAEAWMETNATGEAVIHRRLELSLVPIGLSLTLPTRYPVEAALQVAATLEDVPQQQQQQQAGGPSFMAVRKVVLDALPHLVEISQQVAYENVGEESVFLVLSRAEEWIQEEWPKIVVGADLENPRADDEALDQTLVSHPPIVFGRRLIYSHHIISKTKRADMKRLASDCSLTGYMKVGWPGLLILEGHDENCDTFYNEIRRWNWQYLVVRGEQQDQLVSSPGLTLKQIIDQQRCFTSFLEVDDMSVVAQHCRAVGLESLFRTSMKLYEHNSGDGGLSSGDVSKIDDNRYGVLVLVDHMNDGKGYRKWLRKTAKETGCRLLLKQAYAEDDFSKRPKIIVGVVGYSTEVTSYMKRWRTSRVDVDSRGKACLERQMTVLTDGPISEPIPDLIIFDWEGAMSEDTTTTQAQLGGLLLHMGGTDWKDAFDQVGGS